MELGAEGAYLSHECKIELSIMDKPNIKVGGVVGIYEREQLEDEDLELLVHPNKLSGATNVVGTTLTQNVVTSTTTVFDHIHPNCMVFNENGKLFVGDSRGHISVWDISLR